MPEWPFGDREGLVPPRYAGARAEDLFLLWLMQLPLDADVAAAAHQLLSVAPKTRPRVGVCVLLTEQDQAEALARIELTDLWGIAGRMAQRLRDLGITTPLKLRDADPRFVRGHFSVVLERMVYGLRGVTCIGLEEMTPNRKSLIASDSFGRAVETRHELEQAVAVYASRAAEKMRRQNLASANLTVFVETNRFKPADPHAAQKKVQLPVATSDTGRLIKAAMAALGALWRPGYRYKKAGVMLLDLVPADRVGGGLFDRPDDARSHARSRRSMRSMPVTAAARRPMARPATGKDDAAPGIHVAALHHRMARTSGSLLVLFTIQA